MSQETPASDTRGQANNSENLSQVSEIPLPRGVWKVFLDVAEAKLAAAEDSHSRELWDDAVRVIRWKLSPEKADFDALFGKLDEAQARLDRFRDDVKPCITELDKQLDEEER